MMLNPLAMKYETAVIDESTSCNFNSKQLLITDADSSLLSFPVIVFLDGDYFEEKYYSSGRIGLRVEIRPVFAIATEVRIDPLTDEPVFHEIIVADYEYHGKYTSWDEFGNLKLSTKFRNGIEVLNKRRLYED